MHSPRACATTLTSVRRADTQRSSLDLRNLIDHDLIQDRRGQSRDHSRRLSMALLRPCLATANTRTSMLSHAIFTSSTTADDQACSRSSPSLWMPCATVPIHRHQAGQHRDLLTRPSDQSHWTSMRTVIHAHLRCCPDHTQPLLNNTVKLRQLRRSPNLRCHLPPPHRGHCQTNTFRTAKSPSSQRRPGFLVPQTAWPHRTPLLRPRRQQPALRRPNHPCSRNASVCESRAPATSAVAVRPDAISSVLSQVSPATRSPSLAPCRPWSPTWNLKAKCSFFSLA